MKAKLGTIKGSEIRKNRDSNSNSRILNAEISSREDVQTVELINGQGEDFNPEDEDVVLIISLGDAYKIGLLIDDGIEPDASILPGEKEFYSKSSGVKKAKLKLNKDSEVVLNDGVDFAVAFNKLKTEFNELQAKFNLHVHLLAGVPTDPTLQLSTANIDNTKIEKVRI